MSYRGINKYVGLYRMLDTSYENWKCFQGRPAEPSAQFVFNLLGFLNTSLYLLFKVISHDDGPW